MNVRMVDLPEITVIGKMGLNTREHPAAPALWAEANSHFGEVAALGKRGEDGNYTGFWGAMSDTGLRFLPWEDGFTRGLYLAGVEAESGAEAPEGWTRWVLPARRWLVAEVEQDRYGEVFTQVIREVIPGLGLRLSGAACDFIEPATGKTELYFPVQAEEERRADPSPRAAEA